MSALATIVDLGRIGRVIVASLVAGVGVTLVFAFALLGAVRFADMRRHGRGVPAAGFAVLAAACGALTVATVVFGVVVMAHK